ncbi:MAG: hypothetical protein M3Y13_00230 [Armatimonadota bacterium]|nr:hypothetical protein [Armatimonadota bacterium]
MDNSMSRFNPANIVAACIIAAGLIAASLIVAHKPVSALTNAVPMLPSARPIAMPPITQEAAQEQFQAQVLAAPKLHTFLYNRITHTLSDVKATQVLYSAKDDTFTIPYDLSWQPVMPSGGPQSYYATFNNDGYGHYYGTVIIPGDSNRSQYADVTLK